MPHRTENQPIHSLYYAGVNKSIAVAARINGKTIELFDRNGNRVNYAAATGMAYDEKWVSANVNGNLLVAASDRGTMVTWELRPNSSPVVIGRR